MSPVKLYIYRFEPEETTIDSMEAKDFGDFILVEVENPGLSGEQISDLQDKLGQIYPDKHVLIIDRALDIAFYGVKESEKMELENGS